MGAQPLVNVNLGKLLDVGLPGVTVAVVKGGDDMLG